MLFGRIRTILGNWVIFKRLFNKNSYFITHANNGINEKINEESYKGCKCELSYFSAFLYKKNCGKK